MNNPYSSTIQAGLPLEQSSTQTILPIVQINQSTAILHGFFPISETTFTGTESSFTLAEGDVPLTTITLPRSVDDVSDYKVSQYMAVVYDYRQATDREYEGYTAFVDVNDTGYFSSWSMPIVKWMHRFGRGTLIGNMTVNMAADNPGPQDPTPPSPPQDAGTVRWVSTLDINTAGNQCAFFDFNWISLFQASMNSRPISANKTPVVPLKIEIVSNPPTGEFKASLVSQQGASSPVGGIVFDTIRIIKLKDTVDSGAYEFQFRITDQFAGTHDVELTLNFVTGTSSI